MRGVQATDGSRWFPSKPDGLDKTGAPLAGKAGPCISQNVPGPLPKKQVAGKSNIEADEDDEEPDIIKPPLASPSSRLTSWPAAQERERGR